METAYLTNKHALLSGGGSMLQDNYYSVLNSTSSLVETTYNYENLIALPSVQFGSSTSFQIQNFNFIGRLMLHVRLPQLLANMYLARGWGYAIINNISWTMGSSSTSQITLQGDSILQLAMAQIPDPEKRDEVLQLAGEEYLTPPAAPFGEDVPFIDAYILLPTPFSTWCDKLPYDSNLLSQPVSINIQFNGSASIYGGIGGPRPTQFVLAEVLVHSGELSNKALSLRSKMVADPSLISPYPFTHTQNFITPSFSGVKGSTTLQGCSVQLTSFTNSDITGIIMWCVADSSKSPLNNNTPNPYNLEEMSNILVTYNGRNIFNIPYKAYKFLGMLGDQGPSYFDHSIVDAGNNGIIPSDPKKCYPIYLDFARLRATCMLNGTQHMFNTMRLSNQSLYVRFNTPLDAVQYRLYCTYCYNGCIETQNGISSVYID